MAQKQGFIQLAPHVDFTTSCPTCGGVAKAFDWRVPGQWTLADLKCEACGLIFYQDLPYSLGVVSPVVLNPATGVATPRYSGQWYAEQTAIAWKLRKNWDVSIRVLRNPRGKQACLLNCLFPAWGDALSHLLRVNQLRDYVDVEIIVLINSAFDWLVPDYVSGVWIVDQGFSKNVSWNDHLDAAIKAQVASLGLDLFLPLTFQPAYLTPDEVHEASKIEPFPREEWNKRLQERPAVTYMWRTDRVWSKQGLRRPPSTIDSFLARIRKRLPVLSRLQNKWANAEQLRNVCTLAEELRKVFPKLEFAVCGMGREGALPAWIKDLRVDTLTVDTNHAWSVQGAQSHVLCGVLGSHLCLPGSFAGAYIELIPNDMLRNILTCTSVTSREPRNAIYINRLLPINVDPLYLSDVIAAIMINYSYIDVAFIDKYYKPLTLETLQDVRDALEDRRAALSHLDPITRERLGN